MSDHPNIEGAPHNLPVLSVGEISLALKRHVERAFERVRVRGEITGFRRAASGHLYFTLKDESAVLKGCCWRPAASRLGIQPEDGMEVIVTGRLSTYPGRSEYQIVAESMELAGEGALLKLLEDRRRRLAAEGLFDLERKKPIPYLPQVIGVVTSPTGAVIRDILHRLADRFPQWVLIWPVAVQGEGAAEQIAAAIEGFNRLPIKGARGVPRPDTLIVARGGGSLEDLWAFNEEVVVRAAAASMIPLISAVGHETDTTLIDFAADMRAPTPTAAAELAVPVRVELLTRVVAMEGRLIGGVSRMIAEQRVRVEGLARACPSLSNWWKKRASGSTTGATGLATAFLSAWTARSSILPTSPPASSVHSHASSTIAAASLRRCARSIPSSRRAFANIRGSWSMHRRCSRATPISACWSGDLRSSMTRRERR
jgi:exodeoxyribonuclease VII large subunit